MNRIFPFLLTAFLMVALSVACNKEDKSLVAQLKAQKEELEGNVSEISGAEDVASSDFSITLDRDCYWVDAAGSVKVHYTLAQPAALEAVTQAGWNATVAPAGEKEGDITITAPDPASPGILTLKATAPGGATAESFVQIFVRKPYGNVQSPIIEALAYNGFYSNLATEENYRKLAEAGITIITVEGDWDGWQPQTRLAEAFGVKIVLFVNYHGGLYADDPENYKGLDELINEAKQYPAICAYQIADEPHTGIAYRLAAAKSRIEELDPDHPVYINLHPSSVSPAGMGATTYEEYVEYFANVCNLKFITFDQYPLYIWGIEDCWYRSLKTVYDSSRKRGIPFWAFIQSCREWTRVDPTLETMRLQGNINLAYGAQCNQYFVWKATSGTDYAPIMDSGEYKPVYYDVKEYNREMHNREFVFAKCDARKIRHIGYNYYIHGTGFTTADLPEAISDLSADDCALVSFIGNSGNEYVVVCNKAYDKKLNVDATFTRTVYTIDREGEFTEQAPGAARFTIDEGDMLVIKWK